MFDNDYSKVGPKLLLKLNQWPRILLSLLTLTNSFYLILISKCDHYSVWNYFTFFSAIAWLLFLAISNCFQFENDGTRSLIRKVGAVFLLFNLALLIWACILYFNNSNTCDKCWDFWVLIYIIFGFVLIFFTISSIILSTIRCIANRRCCSSNNNSSRNYTSDLQNRYGDDIFEY